MNDDTLSLVDSPEFKKYPIDTRIKILQDREPMFRNLSPDEQIRFVNGEGSGLVHIPLIGEVPTSIGGAEDLLFKRKTELEGAEQSPESIEKFLNERLVPPLSGIGSLEQLRALGLASPELSYLEKGLGKAGELVKGLFSKKSLPEPPVTEPVAPFAQREEFLRNLMSDVKAKTTPDIELATSKINKLSSVDVPSTEKAKIIEEVRGYNISKGSLVDQANASINDLRKSLKDLSFENKLAEKLSSVPDEQFDELFKTGHDIPSLARKLAKAQKGGEEKLKPLLDKLLRSDAISNAESMASGAAKDNLIQENITRNKKLFNDALPEEERLAKGITSASKKGSFNTSPGDSTVGGPTPETESAINIFGNVIDSLFPPGGPSSTKAAWNKWFLPRWFLNDSPVGQEFFRMFRGADRTGQIIVGKLMGAAQKLKNSSGLSDEEIERVGKSFKGLSNEDITLTPKETEFKAGISKLMEEVYRLATRSGSLEPGQRIDDYLTKIIDIKSGVPRDVVRIISAQSALSDARAGKFGPDILKNINAESEGFLAEKLFNSLPVDVQSKYIDSTTRFSLNRPIKEMFFGPLSKSRLSNKPASTFDVMAILDSYIPGAIRKMQVDTMLQWMQKNSARLSTIERQYAYNVIDSFRGILGSPELMATQAVDKKIMELEAGGHDILAKIKSLDYPRTKAAIVRNMQFLSKIGGNVSTSILNLAGTAISTFTELGLKDTLNGIYRYFTPEGGTLLKKVGIGYELIGGEGRPTIGQLPSEVLSFLFDKTERFNRGVAFLGAYDRAIAEGAKMGPAIQEALDLVDTTQGIYTRSNIPLKFVDPAMSILYQFKQIIFHNAAWAYNIAREGFSADATIEQRMKLARLVLATQAVGGTKAFIPSQLFPYVVNSVNEKDWPDFVKREVLFGLPGLLGVEFGGSTGLRQLPDIPTDKSMILQFIKDLAGPSYGVGPTFFENIGAALKGDSEARDNLVSEMIKNLPAGVEGKRIFDSLSELRGKGDRLQIEEDSEARLKRGIFGQRSTELSTERELGRYIRFKQEDRNIAKKNLKTDISNNLDQIRSGEVTVEELVKKHGVFPSDSEWMSIDKEVRERELPSLARIYESSGDPIKADIMKESPVLFRRIIEETKRAQERINANKRR